MDIDKARQNRKAAPVYLDRIAVPLPSRANRVDRLPFDTSDRHRGDRHGIARSRPRQPAKRRCE
jgi:hypothetical protein